MRLVLNDEMVHALTSSPWSPDEVFGTYSDFTGKPILGPDRFLSMDMWALAVLPIMPRSADEPRAVHRIVGIEAGETREPGKIGAQFATLIGRHGSIERLNCVEHNLIAQHVVRAG